MASPVCRQVWLPTSEVVYQDSSGHRLQSPVVSGPDGEELDLQQQYVTQADPRSIRRVWPQRRCGVANRAFALHGVSEARISPATRDHHCTDECESARNKVREYVIQVGHLPVSLLDVFPGDTSTYPGRSRLDEWQHPVLYTPLDSKQFELRSAGEDNNFGSPDDVVIIRETTPETVRDTTSTQ